MGVPVVFLYRHAIEIALKDIFFRLTGREPRVAKVGKKEIRHDLENWLVLVEELLESCVSNWREHPALEEFPYPMSTPLKLSDGTRKTLAALNAHRYPERYPDEQWSHEFDFEKFQNECESAFDEVETFSRLVDEVRLLESGAQGPEHANSIESTDMPRA